MTSGPIPTTVVGGFLGAGKTTLVNHLLRNAQGRRITVLVNDFGELAIDQDLILAQDGDTLSLANGCACCSTGGDLAKALNALIEAENRPDHLLIEASGVADPDALADIARADPDLKLSGIVVVVDRGGIADLLDDASIGGQVLRQLEAADLVLINKADRPAASDLDARLRALAPRAAWLDVVRGAAPPDLILGDLAPRGRWRADAISAPRHEQDFVRWAWTGGEAMTRADLDDAMAALPAELVRLKGFVRLTDGALVEVQAGRGWREMKTADDATPEGPSRLVAIGLRADFDREALDQLFRARPSSPAAQAG